MCTNGRRGRAMNGLEAQTKDRFRPGPLFNGITLIVATWAMPESLARYFECMVRMMRAFGGVQANWDSIFSAKYAAQAFPSFLCCLPNEWDALCSSAGSRCPCMIVFFFEVVLLGTIRDCSRCTAKIRWRPTASRTPRYPYPHHPPAAPAASSPRRPAAS